MFLRLFGGLMIFAAMASAFSSVGCNQPTKKDISKDQHDDWWCQEHGIPEKMCSLCQADVFEKYKKEGKLCKVHPDRAEEQCFKCDPERYKKYEKMYEDKYGKKPERPPESEFQR